MNHNEPYSDEYLRDILSSVKTIYQARFNFFQILIWSLEETV